MPPRFDGPASPSLDCIIGLRRGFLGKVYDTIDEQVTAWNGRQRLFFVGTAPTSDGGHVNVSPKGPIATLRILGPRQVAYVDLIGSGAEAIAHLRDNERIVVMLCDFEGPPRVVRLHGRGQGVAQAEAGFEERDYMREQHSISIDGLPAVS